MKQNYFMIMVAAVMVIVSNSAKANNALANFGHDETAELRDMNLTIDLVPNLSLSVNESFTLEPKVNPDTIQLPITWYSNNSIVASVSQSGVVTAHSVGSTVVSVRTDNGKKASCKVTVTSSTPDPTGMSWAGTYKVSSSVDRGHVSDYIYPSEFSLTIYENNGAFFATGMVGMVLDSTIYEGLKVNVLDERNAEIDLSYCYELGYHSWTGCFLNCMYMISPQSTFQPEELEEGKIYMTRSSDGTLVIDDFYVFAFGLATDYEVTLDAAYHNVMCKQISSSVPSIIADSEQTGKIEAYNMSGMLVYSGNEDGMPHLSSGIYVIKHGGDIQKILIP